MQYIKILFLLVITIIFSSACKELFLPDDIRSSSNIPVIQGMICEDCLPEVELSWAMDYYDQSKRYIENATVYITDNFGNQDYLTESIPGNYISTESNFKGIVGHIYTLHVITPDGHEYSSLPVPMYERPNIDSLWAMPAIRTVYTYNSQKEPKSEEQEGLNIYAGLSKKADSTLYYRFSTRIIKESTYVRFPSSINPITVYFWELLKTGDDYSIDKSVSLDAFQVIPKHNVDYLRYVYNDLLGDSEVTAPITIGWLLTFRAYAISSGVYDYYSSIQKQLNSNDQLFAPIPFQIKSNMQCMTDPDKQVTGVFEASSVTTIYKAFHFSDLKSYKSQLLPWIPDNESGGTSTDMPDFWISF